jgi:hypothetical protein
MESLIIEATKISPRISFDTKTKIFEIKGESRPENVRVFYDPILNWLNEYGTELLSSNHDSNVVHEFNFKLEYFNSSSSKYIFDILKKVVEFHLNGIQVKVNWFFDEGDEDMQEAGDELSRMVKYPFNYIEVEE